MAPDRSRVISFFDGSWNSLAVYKVHQRDMDTDGVMLDDELVWDDDSPIWTIALDATVPISSSLDFATVGTSLGHPVNGSQDMGLPAVALYSIGVRWERLG